MTDFSREPLPWLMSGLDARKRQVVAELATALGGAGAGPLWAAVKDMAAKLVPQYFDPEERARALRLAAEAQSVMPGVSGPAKAERAKDLVMGFGPADLGGAAAGMLRPGGNPLLMASHGTRLSDLFPNAVNDSLGPPIKELYGPSFAVTGNAQLKNSFMPADNGALFIPRVGALDPQNQTTTLYNRDAFTARTHSMEGFTRAEDGYSPQEVAQGRFRDKFHNDSGIMAEVEMDMMPDFPPMSHQLAMKESPIFRSFAAYEASPLGAGVLSAPPGKLGKWVTGIEGRIDQAIEEARRVLRIPDDEYLSLESWGDVKALLEDAAKVQGPGGPLAMELQSIISSGKRAPSGYGELKASGAVPITGHTFAGVIVPPVARLDQVKAIAEAYAKLGVPVAQEAGPGNYLSRFRLADELQKQAGPYGTRPLK